MHKLHSVSTTNDSSDEDMGEEYLSAKLHLVDLAGSERAKRTGSDGVRLKEGLQYMITWIRCILLCHRQCSNNWNENDKDLMTILQ